ncbi:MAG: ferrochelatase [Helicobacteraceae bacterium]|nr:ferrochelatase [Helicobacteraceae bacterium]
MQKIEKEAIILLNMGGPNSYEEVELFLTNMFNDPYILTMKSSLLRKFVATMITFFRAESSQEIYKYFNGVSPIVVHSKRLVEALQTKVGSDVIVEYIMRYTPPFAPEVIQRLKEQNITKIYLIPLYPQHSSTTTSSSLEDFEDALHRSGLKATTIEIKHYFESKKLNSSILERIKEQLINENSQEYNLVFSAHGLPQKIVDAGDVYQQHIEKHVELLKSMLKEQNIYFESISLAYQSKVGPMQWLEPSLDTALDSFKDKKVLIYPIAFTLDNSETEYELSVEYKEIAEGLNIKEYKVALCPNNHPLFVEALEEIYTKLKTWNS